MQSEFFENNTKRHIACTCCRRRKLKCDGKRPSCGTCRRLNQACEYSDIIRKAGPKRGYVRNLESRLSQLEKLLEEYNLNGLENGECNNGHLVSLHIDEPLPPAPLVEELTELFFSKFNVMLPFIDKTRYDVAMKMGPMKQPRAFLQYAIMATAAADSPRHSRLKTIFYTRARKYLYRAQNLRHINGAASVGFLQALVLIAHYEAREGLLPQAWISVGTAYRALLMMQLHTLDAKSYNDPIGRDSYETAECRRAFWFLLLSERLGSMVMTMPGMIDLSIIFTKVPLDDDAFLAGNYDTETLSMEELLRQPTLLTRYPRGRMAYLLTMTECIYQGMELGRFPEKKYQNAPKEWMTEYERLEKCLGTLCANMPAIPAPQDMPDEVIASKKELRAATELKSRRVGIIIINLLGHVGSLAFCRTGIYGIQAMPILLPLFYPAKLVQRAMMSMLEILLITRNPHDLTVISAHPVQPCILFVVCVVLFALSEYDLVALDNFQAPLAYMVDTLRQLTESMPLTKLFTGFLVAAMSNHRDDGVKRVEDVIVSGGVNITLPNFFNRWTDITESDDSGPAVTPMTKKCSAPVDDLEMSMSDESPRSVQDYRSENNNASDFERPDYASDFAKHVKTEDIGLDFADAVDISTVIAQREQAHNADGSKDKWPSSLFDGESPFSLASYDLSPSMAPSMAPSIAPSIGGHRPESVATQHDMTGLPFLEQSYDLEGQSPQHHHQQPLHLHQHHPQQHRPQQHHSPQHLGHPSYPSQPLQPPQIPSPSHISPNHISPTHMGSHISPQFEDDPPVMLPGSLPFDGSMGFDGKMDEFDTHRWLAGTEQSVWP